ncbi:MAG: sigma-54 dependent transcriptional regulator [Alistipes sp.]|jgi:DNA-binding NtrC family response regulator|nr:sigma-54 dependent transcriptional regulator [Alistipes sp.]
MPNILIMEAQRGIRNTLRERLEYEKYTVEAVADREEATAVVQRFEPDLFICDHCPNLGLKCPFIIISNDTSVELAVEAVRSGAMDFIPKPIDMNHLLASIKKATGNTHQTEEHDLLQPRTTTRKTDPGPQEIVGNSNKIKRVKELIDRIAPSDARVLVTGENGTGKELVAHWIHAKSKRAASQFVEINCAAIPSELIESELFGHEKGAFTSAIKQRKGKFEQASGGTLFMDEIGDMSLSAQAKVLRALQENRISRVGSDRDIEVDVRVVAATNKNLKEEIREGRFREDLYHRLSVIIIHVPPLCERAGDIPILASHFAERICREYGIANKTLGAECIEILETMPWTGNIRELRNVIERLIVLGGDRITVEDIHAYVSDFV